MKTESILGGKVAKITGWATGLAIPYLFFSSESNLSPSALKVVDISLALCIIVFAFVGFIAVYSSVREITIETHTPARTRLSTRIQGWAFSIAFMLCGYYILDIAPQIQGATRTATVLGTCIAGLGTVALYRSVIMLMKRKKT